MTDAAVPDCRVRSMTAADLSLVREWRNHPEIRRFMFTQHEIGAEEHAAWFAKQSADESRKLLIFECGGIPLGFASLGRVAASEAWDWGFYLSPAAPKGTGRLLGRSVLNFAFSRPNIQTLRAQVLDFNERSIRFHRSLGFRQDDSAPQGTIGFTLSRDVWLSFTEDSRE
jgi:UDP-4-amino-4,6-dideoxy-N-acetyl-beta-L-altrosamine N-acetyltransferase